MIVVVLIGGLDVYVVQDRSEDSGTDIAETLGGAGGELWIQRVEIDFQNATAPNGLA